MRGSEFAFFCAARCELSLQGSQISAVDACEFRRKEEGCSLGLTFPPVPQPDVWPSAASPEDPQDEAAEPSAAPQCSNALICSNAYLSDTPRFKIPRVLEAKARGPSCFDFEFYQSHNKDLAGDEEVNSTSALWKHYVYFGQFESRPYRFTCPFDYARLLTIFS